MTNFQSLVQDIQDFTGLLRIVHDCKELYTTVHGFIGQDGTMKDAILYNTIVKQDAALSKTGLDTTIEEYERL